MFADDIAWLHHSPLTSNHLSSNHRSRCYSLACQDQARPEACLGLLSVSFANDDSGLYGARIDHLPPNRGHRRHLGALLAVHGGLRCCDNGISDRLPLAIRRKERLRRASTRLAINITQEKDVDAATISQYHR